MTRIPAAAAVIPAHYPGHGGATIVARVDGFAEAHPVEGAGIVESVGPGVEHVKPGDRVAYAGPIGCFVLWRRMVYLGASIAELQRRASDTDRDHAQRIHVRGVAVGADQRVGERHAVARMHHR